MSTQTVYKLFMDDVRMMYNILDPVVTFSLFRNKKNI